MCSIIAEIASGLKKKKYNQKKGMDTQGVRYLVTYASGDHQEKMNKKISEI